MIRQSPRYGLSLPNRGILFGVASVATLLEVSERAEKSGAFESIWVGDSLFIKPRLEALVLLSAIAARTRTVRLGTCCLSTFPLRDPIFLAAQWAALDQISHGRMILGACIGGALPREKAEAEFAAFKITLGERREGSVSYRPPGITRAPSKARSRSVPHTSAIRRALRNTRLDAST